MQYFITNANYSIGALSKVLKVSITEWMGNRHYHRLAQWLMIEKKALRKIYFGCPCHLVIKLGA